MKYFSILLISICIFLTTFAQKKIKEQSKIILPNGWKLSPAGHGFLLGDLPLNIAVSNSKKLMAVTNNGQSVQSIQLIDVASGTVSDNIVVTECWLGLKFSADEKTLYASGGNNNWILKYAIRNKKLLLVDSLKLGNKWPNPISPAGIELDDKKNILYIVTKDNNSLYTLNTTTKKVTGIYKLDGEAYTCLLSPDKKKLYITCWGCDKLYVFNTLLKKITDTIETGSHPNDMCLTKSGKFLFVANANDNSVSVINLSTKKVIETLTSSLYPNAPQGSTTNGVALSPDENTLYIANADNNCVSVFNVGKPGSSMSKGFIPTGWYPTCVKAIGNKIYVTNGKGFTSFANPEGPDPYKKKETITFRQGDTSHIRTTQYIGGLFIGTMSIINVPDAKKLASYSQQVYFNTPYTKEKETVAEGEKIIPFRKKLVIHHL